jgi:hypothetical protein
MMLCTECRHVVVIAAAQPSRLFGAFAKSPKLNPPVDAALGR